MIRVGERIARSERAKALVTGESLGQVASQTLDNIRVVDDAATLPVLRPLIGNDKLEIIADAQRIGTYELSIQEHTDCCTLFMPRTPETHARLVNVLEAWDALPHERMVEDAIATMTWVDFPSQSYRPPKEWPTLHTESAL
jgi:thiamine biosynthesis protein ThiI